MNCSADVPCVCASVNTSVSSIPMPWAWVVAFSRALNPLLVALLRGLYITVPCSSVIAQLAEYCAAGTISHVTWSCQSPPPTLQVTHALLMSCTHARAEGVWERHVLHKAMGSREIQFVHDLQFPECHTCLMTPLSTVMKQSQEYCNGCNLQCHIFARCMRHARMTVTRLAVLFKECQIRLYRP